MFIAKTPLLLQKTFPHLLWRVNNARGKVYLTFDDGPTPNVTDWVLDMLDNYEAKATFFCVGENVTTNQGIYQEIIKRGHTTGNHTNNHVNGWATDDETYLNEVAQCSKVIDSKLFRPPYGRITPGQIKALRRDYQIVMWDVLSGDYDQNITAKDCTNNVMDNYKDGSIIVFHDSLKAEKNLKATLPTVLELLSRKAVIFESINPFF